jgi:hypothetical protein
MGWEEEGEEEKLGIERMIVRNLNRVLGPQQLLSFLHFPGRGMMPQPISMIVDVACVPGSWIFGQPRS